MLFPDWGVGAAGVTWGMVWVVLNLTISEVRLDEHRPRSISLPRRRHGRRSLPRRRLLRGRQGHEKDDVSGTVDLWVSLNSERPDEEGTKSVGSLTTSRRSPVRSSSLEAPSSLRDVLTLH